MSEHISNAGLSNLINVIDCFLPRRVYKSKYRFLKEIALEPHNWSYCEECAIPFKIEPKVNEFECLACRRSWSLTDLKKSQKIFHYIPLEGQLKRMVQSDLYLDLRKTSPDNDIVNGKFYQDLRAKGVIGENDITLQWSADGVSLFNSSNVSIWPIQVSINELPYRKRRNNVLLCGLWLRDDNKVNMNVFLRPFVDELKSLHTRGFLSPTRLSEEPVLIKVHVLLAPVDTIARNKIQNLTQFNGSYGCSYCLLEGERTLVGRSQATVYRGAVARLRNAALHRVHVRIAVEQGTPIRGVKGPSVISILPVFDIIDSLPPDFMHCGVLGVIETFFKEWMKSGNHEEDWYLGGNKEQLNKILLSIKPPRELTKTPIVVEKLSKYTANDSLYFGLYYSLPCLKNVLPPKYWKHWFLFVYSIYIFSKSRVTDEEFHKATRAMERFVYEIEDHYPLRFMRYNTHLLLHIPRYVKLFGSLWAWSAFTFEHFNGILKKLFYGTQYASEQICKQYQRLHYVKANAKIFGGDGCSQQAKDTFRKLMRQIRIKNCIQYDENLKIFGRPQKKTLTLTEKTLCENLLGQEIKETGFSYHRFLYMGTIYHSKNYKRMLKRNNSTVKTNENTFMTITELVTVNILGENNSTPVIFANPFVVTDYGVLCKNGEFSSLDICTQLEETDNLICAKVSSLDKKCIKIPYEDKYCVFALANEFERD